MDTGSPSSPAARAALAVADCGIGLVAADGMPPWFAQLVCSADLADAWFVLDTCATARELSRQSARIALVGAGFGSVIAFAGVVPFATQRVATAVNLAAVAAMANGVRAAALHDGRAMPAPPATSLVPWHQLSAHDVLGQLGTDVTGGLPPAVAAARFVPPAPPVPVPLALARAVGDELVNPLTPVLAAGAGLSLAVGSVVDATLITSVVALNAVIGGVQRFRTDQAISALSHRDQRSVTVVRGGERRRIPATDLVVGDLLAVQAGDVVAADCRVVRARALLVDESSLTGESDPVEKRAAPTDAVLVAERTSMLYEDTAIAAGRATAVVVATGDDTEARRALVAAGTPPPSGVEARLESLMERVIPVTIGAGVGVLGVGLLRGRPLAETANAGISLAMAAAPEGLPLLASVAQLRAARRLSDRGALVRNPRAIEALGRVDVLCADKTGTLTEGRAKVVAVAPDGRSEDLDDLSVAGRRVVAAAARATPREHAGRRLAHPTDHAVVDARDRAAVELDLGAPGWERVADLPFEPGRGYHATLGRRGDGGLLSVKGAPEIVLDLCTHRSAGTRSVRLTAPQRARLETHLHELTGDGLRVLAVAERVIASADVATAADGDGGESVASFSEALVEGLRFVGFVALRDPVRASTRPAIAGARAAGVRIVMITGDHPSTAMGVAEELGLADGGALTGAEIDGLDEAALGERLETAAVCARVTPAHKVRIVRALQARGHSVAMTGDGSNDAPAIRLADVGIALGSRATDAAREAADVVVTDDRIETIVDAIAEGRTMWASVRDAVAILVGGNLGEVAFTLGGSLISGTPPLNARQLLLVNLLTDIAPAMAIAVRPPAEGTVESVLREGPDRSLGSALDRAIILRAASTAAGARWGGAPPVSPGRRRGPAPSRSCRSSGRSSGRPWSSGAPARWCSPPASAPLRCSPRSSRRPGSAGCSAAGRWVRWHGASRSGRRPRPPPARCWSPRRWSAAGRSPLRDAGPPPRRRAQRAQRRQSPVMVRWWGSASKPCSRERRRRSGSRTSGGRLTVAPQRACRPRGGARRPRGGTTTGRRRAGPARGSRRPRARRRSGRWSRGARRVWWRRPARPARRWRGARRRRPRAARAPGGGRW